jgi:hypothetical protein
MTNERAVAASKFVSRTKIARKHKWIEEKSLIVSGKRHGRRANPGGPVPARGIERPLGYALGADLWPTELDQLCLTAR